MPKTNQMSVITLTLSYKTQLIKQIVNIL